MKNQTGFTIVELVTVIILLGILSAVALPRFFDNDSFTDSFARNDLNNALSWARNQSVTRQCAHEIRIENDGWAILRDTTCGNTAPEAACAAGEVYEFTNPALGSNSEAVSGDAIKTTAATTSHRLIFTPNGQLFEATDLSPAFTDCTSLESNPVAAASAFSLNNATLTIDGETAYANVE